MTLVMCGCLAWEGQVTAKSSAHVGNRTHDMPGLSSSTCAESLSRPCPLALLVGGAYLAAAGLDT